MTCDTDSNANRQGSTANGGYKPAPLHMLLTEVVGAGGSTTAADKTQSMKTHIEQARPVNTRKVHRTTVLTCQPSRPAAKTPTHLACRPMHDQYHSNQHQQGRNPGTPTTHSTPSKSTQPQQWRQFTSSGLHCRQHRQIQIRICKSNWSGCMQRRWPTHAPEKCITLVAGTQLC
jgi:hypothetical protein